MHIITTLRRRVTAVLSLAWVVVFLPLSGSLAAAEPSESQQQIIQCMTELQISTTWDQCRRQLFLNCETHEVGSEPHLACLTEQRSEWQQLMNGQVHELEDKLTIDGNTMLSELLSQWFGYVHQRCTKVADSKRDISEKAARLGCEISEFAGINTEFNACLTGISGSPYCSIQGTPKSAAEAAPESAPAPDSAE